MKKAFTLIELLVSCAVIAVIATLVLVTYTEAQKKSRDSRRKADLESIAQAVTMYKVEKGYYPFSQSGIWSGYVHETQNTSFSTTLTQELVTYLSPMPWAVPDPQSIVPHDYYYYVNANKFSLFSGLENRREEGFFDCSLPSGVNHSYNDRRFNYVTPKQIIPLPLCFPDYSGY